MASRIEHEINHGNKISEHAEDIWGWITPAGKVRAERRADYFIKMGEFTGNSNILEIGCGTGLFTEKVYNKTKAKITAIDISQTLLDKAKAKLPDVAFKTDDAMNLSFGNNSFIGVFGSSVLHHLDIEKAFKEIFRVLKPEGKMIFAEPNMLNPQIFIQKNIPFIKKLMGDSPDETAIVRWNTSKLLKNTGFKNVNIFPYDFLHPKTPEFMLNFVNRLGKISEKIPLIKEIAGSVIIYAEKP